MRAKQEDFEPKVPQPPRPGAGAARKSDAVAAQPAFDAQVPVINLPKGGGAIRGIGEKFVANPVTGTGSMSVPIASSPGRSGFGPQLALSYDSGAGNGPFGFGWSLALPAITRKTDKGLPQYLDDQESDVFVLSSAEDLVPILERDQQDNWVRQRLPNRNVAGVAYRIDRYRPRIEGLFARIERWSNTGDRADVFWRSISKDNITTWYGKTPESRITDPADATRIFSWLICQSHDSKGNVVVYGYKPEDSTGVLDSLARERNRTVLSRTAQRYLKRIRYGNRSPYLPQLSEALPWPEPAGVNSPDGSDAWMFELVFDYGDHPLEAPVPAPPIAWPVRVDPFSSYRAGFEVRTYRKCQRALMFHHFPDEAGVERDCLVRSTDFAFSDEPDPAGTRHPIYTFLKAVTQTGYRREGTGYVQRSMPPVEFTYSEPVVQELVEEVDPRDITNLPIGIDDAAYRWVDLHGEGVPGILSEQAGAWFYKRNLSPLPDETTQEVRARFAPLEVVTSKPNAALSTGAQFMDLAGDGQPDVVVMEGPAPGLYEHDDAEGWQRFRAFTSRLSRDLADPNVKFVDLDGDGHADVLITEDDAFLWHTSMAEEGFGPARRVAQALDEEKGPRIVFADGTQSIYLADLCGDGLTDIVRIRNGEVCYWPNLGYGRFGAKVTMDNAPWFDNPDQFDHRRIRIADIDGSGTGDIIYLHRDGVRLYFNQSGNSWSAPQRLKVFPRIDDVASIVPLDLLGNGTACLVWSSSLPGDARRPMRYVNLMGGRKPHLLFNTSNNLGAETRVEYAPSTKFYLQDKRDGKPWITRLPFPVHVIERVETWDHISRSRFVTRYAYHHGYFDGDEREFRGFGMVEQWDTEEITALADGAPPSANIDATSHVPPVHTKTWFHTGVALGRDSVSLHFEGEYYREPGLDADSARALLLDDSPIPQGLTPEEEREACRALKGSMLRQEVYADDAGPGATPKQVRRANTPFTVAEQNFAVRAVQPRGTNRHAVFFIHAREALSYHYERNDTFSHLYDVAPADPRLQHALTLEVDDYGNVLKQAAIGYGRRERIRVVDPQGNSEEADSPGLLPERADRDKQTTALLTYTENRVTNAIDSPDTHLNPLPCEAETFELTRYTASGQSGRFQASDFVEPDPANPARLRHKFNAPEVAYEATATGEQRRRPIEWLRTLYRRDDLAGMLPLGEVQSLALPGESYKLAFTLGLIKQVFQRPVEGQPPEQLLPDPAAVLGGQGGDRGGYVQSQELKADGRFPPSDADDHWWAPSGRTFFHPDDVAPPVERAEAKAHFFLPRRYVDPFAQPAVITYEHDLLMVEARDALDNVVRVEANDYRVLQPRLVSDPNRNQTEVAFDSLGMVVGTALMGKPSPANPEGDSLDGFAADLDETALISFFDAEDPRTAGAALLVGATTRMVYDLDRFRRTRLAYLDDPTQWQPACAATIARETHLHAPVPPGGMKFQFAFSYSDGFGREVQKKAQAEPGPVPQRDAAGRIIVGPDGQPVMTDTDAEPRWVGSGWTVFNNKGNPVRQYQPFFTDTHWFEFDMRIGVSPVLFYDAAGRAIATLHPNHTYDKVVFDPWQQTTWDVNDTCAPRPARPGDSRPPHTGDPRTDPDIGGLVSEYFKTQPATWQTWMQQRIADPLHPPADTRGAKPEQDAAVRALAHADTPTTAHFDALGRPFLTLAHNRVVCPDHDLHNTEAHFATRVEIDIEGNQRTVRDAVTHTEARDADGNLVVVDDSLGRIVMRYAYDMLGNRIHQLSMEAGARWTLSDVTGKPIRAWDSRGHNFTTSYDELRRPVEQVVRGTFSNPDPLKPNSDPRTLGRDILFDRIVYGESLGANAAALNLCTRVFQHFNSAGIVTNARLDSDGSPTEAYDFKGNLLRNTRRLVSDYKAIPDWRLDPARDDEFFEGSTRYDALNRPIQSIAPRSSLGRGKFNVTQPTYNAASLLNAIDVWERASEPSGLLDPAHEGPPLVGVSDIDYDAKGQRLRIEYSNNVTTAYRYDRLTFRLIHLLTKRRPADFPGDDPQEVDPKWPGKQAQNLLYAYDPAGNLTHIHDDAQQRIFFNGQRVDPSNDYVYDASYRLIEATGREHLGQGQAPIPHSHDDAGRVGLLHPGDGNAMGRYVERYVYDAVGNVLQIQHRGSTAAHAGWTRTYDYLEASLIEVGAAGGPLKTNNRLSRTNLKPAGTTAQPEEYLHDAHGNMVRMPHLTRMEWEYRDRLLLTSRQVGNDTPPPDKIQQATHYVYDASGQRVRRVWEKAPGLTEERIYLGGFEIFRKHRGRLGANSVTLERETLHVMDDKQRISLVETLTLDSTGNAPAPRQLIRYQFGNQLGSASLELDDLAQIITYEEYTPYGSTSYQAVRSQTDTPKRYRYTGKERDEQSGLCFHAARYYLPWLGRWTTPDPAGTVDGVNLYVYVANNPIRYADPSGTEKDNFDIATADGRADARSSRSIGKDGEWVLVEHTRRDGSTFYSAFRIGSEHHLYFATNSELQAEVQSGLDTWGNRILGQPIPEPEQAVRMRAYFQHAQRGETSAAASQLLDFVKAEYTPAKITVGLLGAAASLAAVTPRVRPSLRTGATRAGGVGRVGPAGTIPEDPGAFLERGVFGDTTGTTYMVRAGPAGRYGDHLFQSLPEAEAYARQLAATGEMAIRESSALPRVWPGGAQGNPVNAVNIFEVPPKTPYIQGVVGPQFEGGKVFAAPRAYTGGGPQVVIDRNAKLNQVASYPITATKP